VCYRRPVSAGAVPLGLGLSMSMNKRGTVPVRDETGRFTGVRPKTAAERLQVGMHTMAVPDLTEFFMCLGI